MIGLYGVVLLGADASNVQKCVALQNDAKKRTRANELRRQIQNESGSRNMIRGESSETCSNGEHKFLGIIVVQRLRCPASWGIWSWVKNRHFCTPSSHAVQARRAPALALA